ncbi:MAG TPA: DMT family transporter, partial [Verrucomicrobiae bacterium]|nr:DMT family transporter [Verrucomicrobiae bacterium]
MHSNRTKQLKADLSLVLVTLVWGATFVTVKNAVADMPPFRFIAIRFAIACVFLMLLAPRKLKLINRANLIPGTLIGLFLFGGYSFQTIGLKYTSASNAGFITGLSVVLVPL